MGALDLHEIKRLHGGQVYGAGRRWLGPGPGHSPQDRSLSVEIGEEDRVLIHSFAGDSFRTCAAYLGLSSKQMGEIRAHSVNWKRGQRRPANQQREREVWALCERVWAASRPIEGTPAERYLNGRGVAAADDLRYSATAPWGYSGVREGPALIALVRSVTAAAKGLHVTHILPDGSGKAGWRSRRMFGNVRGGAVWLQPASEELAVAEGIETAASFAELFAIPTWAALSTSGLVALEIPARVRRLIVAADNDDNGAGLIAARRLAARARVRCEVVIRAARPGRDWNDEIMAVGR